MVRDVVFVHGWGFSTSLWDGVIAQLEDINPHVVDLGFFGSPQNTINLPDNSILIGHSLGVMWLLKHLPHNPAGLISINGFDCFYRYTDKAILQAMQLRLRRNPLALMQAFWAGCGYDSDTNTPNDPDTERLAKGLDWLMQWDMEKAHRKLSCPVLALASKDDRILPHQATSAIWAGDTLCWRETESHILPVSDHIWCAEHIKEFRLGLE